MLTYKHWIVLSVSLWMIACTTTNTSTNTLTNTLSLIEDDSVGGYALETFEHASVNAPANQVYFFEKGQSQIQTDDRPSIDAQAQYLISHPKAIVRIEANTDTQGSREYNIALAERRAKVIADLLKQSGARAYQIKIVSYGAEKPAVLGRNDESLKLNRRAYIIYEEL